MVFLHHPLLKQGVKVEWRGGGGSCIHDTAWALDGAANITLSWEYSENVIPLGGFRRRRRRVDMATLGPLSQPLLGPCLGEAIVLLARMSKKSS